MTTKNQEVKSSSMFTSPNGDSLFLTVDKLAFEKWLTFPSPNGDSLFLTDGDVTYSIEEVGFRPLTGIHYS